MALGEFFFFFFGALVVAGTLGTVLSKNPVNSALFLVLNFFSLGGLYLALEAQFIAVVQVIVYAGAIMVLFLFTIMLLNLDDETSLIEKFDLKKGVAFLVSGAVLIEILYIIGFHLSPVAPTSEVLPAEIGGVKAIGKVLLTEYLFPFEIISVILLLAIIGAVILAKRNTLAGKTAI